MRYFSLLAMLALSSSCIPPRPKTTNCAVDINEGIGRCSDGETVTHKPLQQLDGYICKSLPDYTTDETWISDMKKRVEACKQ